MYVSTGVWRDLTDGHLYREGEPFPHDGREIAPERIAELKDGHNRAGLCLIQEAAKRDEGADAPTEEKRTRKQVRRKTKE